MTRVSVQRGLPPMELQTLKRRPDHVEGPRKKVSCALVSQALSRANLSQKEAAITMEISESLLARQLKGSEHLSWQRLFLLPDAFWLELVFVVAEARGIAKVRRTMEEAPPREVAA